MQTRSVSGSSEVMILERIKVDLNVIAKLNQRTLACKAFHKIGAQTACPKI